VDGERPDRWCTVRRAGDGTGGVGGYQLRFGASDTVEFLGQVASLKSRVARHARRFDPATKSWRVARSGGPALRLWLRSHFSTAEVRLLDLTMDDLRDAGPGGWDGGWGEPDGRRGWEETPRQHAPAPPAGPYDTLWLKPGAPQELIAAAYKILALRHHPDRGGSHEAMVAINKAYEALKRGQKGAA
jgi:hypothetical protein